MIQLQKTLKTFAQRRETRRARMCSTLRDTSKKTLSSHDMVDSHPLHLLPMIYRSRYTNFISSFSPEITMCDASLVKNNFFLFAGVG